MFPLQLSDWHPWSTIQALPLGITVTMNYHAIFTHTVKDKNLFSGLFKLEIYSRDLSNCSRLQTSIWRVSKWRILHPTVTV